MGKREEGRGNGLAIASCHGDIGLLFYRKKVKLCPPDVYTIIDGKSRLIL